MCSRATGTGYLSAHLGQRTRVDRELGGVEGLDAGVLLAVERGHGRDLRTGLAAQGERQVGVVEPQAPSDMASAVPAAAVPSPAQIERRLRCLMVIMTGLPCC